MDLKPDNDKLLLILLSNGDIHEVNWDDGSIINIFCGYCA